MGIFDRLLGRRDHRAVVAEPGRIVMRRKELAEHLQRPTAPYFSTEPQPPCEKCGKPLAEVLVTTGGPLADPDVWRDHPVAVDAWACVDCSVLRYPRTIEPERITELSDEGIAHARAGRFDEADLCFVRVVWNWPGYVGGHINYAGSLGERLRVAPPKDELTRHRITRRMIEQHEEAIASYSRNPTPIETVESLARSCLVLADLAIKARSFERATRYLEICLAYAGLPELARKAAEARSEDIKTRRDLFDGAHRVLDSRIGFANRAARPPTNAQERKQIVEAIEDLERYMKIVPERWEAASLHAKALLLVGNQREGLEAWSSAFERFGDRREIAQEYVLELLRLERIPEAREVARAIAARLPEDLEVWSNVAVTELLCGDLDAADRALERSRTLDPGDKITRILTERMRGYRSGNPVPRTLRELERPA